jgi:hypothetical protein
VLIFLILWNVDGVWQIKTFEGFLQNTFPEKFQYEQLRIENGEKNSVLLKSYLNDRDLAIESEKQMRKQHEAMTSKVDQMCKYYDESLRVIQILKDEIEPKDFRAIIEVQPKVVQEIVDPNSPANDICK